VTCAVGLFSGHFAKVRWKVDDYLQQKCKTLKADCVELNKRYMELRTDNRKLEKEVDALKQHNETLRKQKNGGNRVGGTAEGNQNLLDELDNLRRTLKEYGNRLVRLGTIS
jgi:chromosome segregation ATPase